MEDVDFIFDSVRVTDKRSVGVYGVLDGHGGKECGEHSDWWSW
jgi:serine/threonine protein phosphatase PrpC